MFITAADLFIHAEPILYDYPPSRIASRLYRETFDVGIPLSYK
jgi:hypothetical protein